jgi:hypothetical protein
MAPCLITSARASEDRALLTNAALAAGYHVTTLDGWRVPASLQGIDGRLYAEPLFADVVAGPLGLLLLEPPLDWLVGADQQLLGRTVWKSTVGELRKQTTPFFCKPLDDKRVSPRVYVVGDDLPHAQFVDDDLPMLVSTPLHMELELRLFVLEGRIVTGSSYLRNGHPYAHPLELLDLQRQADGVLSAVLSGSHTSLPPAFVLDIARLPDGSWVVVELNAAWGSGLYRSDPSAALPSIMASTIPQSAGDHIDPAVVRTLPEVEF